MFVGIPRALGYYMYFPFWVGFFQDLGIEVKVSRKTNKKLVSAGGSLLVPETCLPVKVYVGHVLDLLDKGIDNIYCPSIQSTAPKIYNCSKLRGLPDLIRNVIRRDFNLIEPTLDKSVKNQGLYEYLYDSVKFFGITDKKLIKKASKAGWVTYNKYRELMQMGYSYNDCIDYISGKKQTITLPERNHSISIAVCSHAYNIYDEHFSMKIIDKLNMLGANSYVPDNLSNEALVKGIDNIDAILYWANELEVTGCAGHYMKDPDIDGIITLTAFGCGPDSLMIERITRFAKRNKKPLLNLTIDEHTGEAGFITRLEAFTDMLHRKKRNKIINTLKKQVGDKSPITTEEPKVSGLT